MSAAFVGLPSPALLGVVPLPPLQGSRFGSTSFDPVPVLLIVAALALYLYGVRSLRRHHPHHHWPASRTAAFVAGLVTTAVGVFSFIGVYDSELFWDHMVQHLLLIMVAGPLFAYASPVALAWRATTGALHRRMTRILRSPLSQLLGHPVVAFVVYAVIIPLTHLTSFYNLTLENEPLHNLEHIIYLFVGYLFWRQIFGIEPNRFRLHPALKYLYLFLALPIDTFTGLSLDNAGHELFPAYLAFHRTWGPTLVEDLHIGGVIMWVGGDTLMLWPMVPVALHWMHMEERRGVRADREADEALLASPASVPPHRTGGNAQGNGNATG
ncbi:MAG: cytochrome c oxidase assembly protein [Acidimicrobiales bacterium]